MDNRSQRVLYFLTLTILPIVAFFTTSIATFVLGIAVSNSLVATLLVIAGIVGFVSTILAAPVFYRSAMRQANIAIAFLPAPSFSARTPSSSTRRNTKVEEEWSDDDLFGGWGDEEDDAEPLIRRSKLKSGKKTSENSPKSTIGKDIKKSSPNQTREPNEKSVKDKKGVDSGSSFVEKDSATN